MLTRRAWLAGCCAASPGAVGCGGSREIEVLDWPELRARVSGQAGLVYFWALWSRPSIELLSTVAELAAEYEGLPVVAVCLDDDPTRATARAEAVARSLPVWLEHCAAPLDFERLLADFAVSAPPAAVIRDGSGGQPVCLEGDALTPDRLDAFVSEAAAMMTTPLLGR